MDIRLLKFPLFLIIIIFALSATVYGAETKIKVRIASALKNIQIRGLDLKRTRLFHNQDDDSKTKQYFGSKAIRFNCGKISSRILKKSKPIMLARISSPTGLVSWDADRYRGELTVQTTPHRKSCDLINTMELEHYISSLLAKEMKSSWPLEALKAQAVAARSYAYFKINRSKPDSGFHLINSEKHQVNGTFFDETITTYKAANQTRGEVLISNSGKLTPIFYHAKCGGVTLTPDEVWGNHVDGYKSVKSSFKHNNDRNNWKSSISLQGFRKILPKLIKKSRNLNSPILPRKISKVRIIADDLNKKIVRIYVGENLYMIKKIAFRRVLGRGKISSNYFKVTRKKNRVSFVGKGKGHGVGMCQYGALELAQMGKNYKQILKYFFPDHRLTAI